MTRTKQLLIGVSVALIAVGLATSPVSAFEQNQNPATVDVGTNCECFDSGDDNGGDDDGGSSSGELESSLDGGFIYELDSGGSGGDDGSGGGGGELKR